ncbi:MAG TPA: hypothetical protein DEQ02_05360 [Ruminococcaceae bacterium]|nr:hypothetical protein [Oscillospiraceae bacterium]
MPGEGRLVLSELDEKRMPSGFLRAVNQELPEGYKLRQDGQTHIDPVGGFLLVYEGIEINCTFASLLQSRREQLEDTVVGILFS